MSNLKSIISDDQINNRILLDSAEDGDLHNVIGAVCRGADINHSDDLARTAIFLASLKGHIEIVKFLLENNASPEGDLNLSISPLYAATCRGHLEVVMNLIAFGALIDRHLPNIGTAIIAAAESRQEEIAINLLQAGADYNSINPDGEPLLKLVTSYQLNNLFGAIIAKKESDALKLILYSE